MGVKESPGNGAPHLILLQDKNCNVLQPKETSVTGIWEAWGGWKLTVSWTKSYYQDGRLVKQEKGGWSTPWNIFRTQIKDPSEIPGLWKDFGGKPFEGIREVMSSFEPPPDIPFNPANWNLITHATTDAGNNQILTAPFVTGLGTDKNNNLTFQQRDRTVCESAPPTAPLLANTTTLPWTVGPFGVDIAPDPKSTYTSEFVRGVEFEVARSVSLGVRYDRETKPRVGQAGGLSRKDFLPAEPDVPGLNDPATATTETRPGTTATTETRRPDSPQTMARPDSPRIEHRPDGTKITTRPDGTQVETRPDGTTVERRPFPFEITPRFRKGWEKGMGPFVVDFGHLVTTEVETRPDGTRIETRADGSKVETRPDGTRIWTNPDGTTSTTLPVDSSIEVEPDVPGLEDSSNALPVDQVM
jgi:hypothetical protein